MEVGLVAHDQACAEEKTDGKNGANEHVSCDVDLLCAVQEVGCTLEDPCPDRLAKRTH